MLIKVHDKYFTPYISQEEIISKVQNIATAINRDFDGQCPIFIAVLNGSFMFAADIMKYITIPCEISFIKAKSYTGMQSSGHVLELIGLDVSINDRAVIILEDIIDTGHTIKKLLNTIKKEKPLSISIAALLVKPDALQYTIQCDYLGMNIPNKFVVGYGLDYDGLGRNYSTIYQLVD